MFMMCEQCTGSYTTQPLINPNNHINLTQCYDAAENSNGTIAYSTSDMPCFHVGRPSSEASIGKSWKSRGQPGPHGTLRGCSRGPIRARCGVGVHDLDCWYTGILILSLIKVVCQMWVEDQTIKKTKKSNFYLFCLFHFILKIIHSICFISSAKHSSIQQHGSMSTDLLSLSHQCLVEDRENSACLEAATHDNSGCNNKFLGIQSCIWQSNDRSNHLNHSESMYSHHAHTKMSSFRLY